jgi:hypothetical protein
MQMFFSLAAAKSFLKTNGFRKLAGNSYINSECKLASIANNGSRGVYVVFAD